MPIKFVRVTKEFVRVAKEFVTDKMRVGHTLYFTITQHKYAKNSI
jgi:hypothetical protein